MTETRLKIAVFIDFDNIEIGVKTTLGQQFDIASILDAIKERGEVVTKVAYGDWKRAGDHGRLLSQHAIRMVQRNLTPGGDKNGADINLALDALEMAFTHDHINAFVIVGGDSDFITLVEKLKQYDKKVFVVGGRQFTSLVMQKNCHEFIAYENLVRAGRQPSEQRRSQGASSSSPTDVSKALPLVRRALKVLTDREVSPQLGLLKSTLLQLDSTFSERDYGASTFRDFVEKVAQTGTVVLRHAGRSLLVELADDAQKAEAAAPPVPEAPLEAPAPEPAHAEAPVDEAPAEVPQATQAPAEKLEPEQAVERAREIFSRVAQPPRWPMYVRQVKQFLRAADDGFDERKYGYQSIIDFLRAGQREAVFRLERDRQGVLRVFPGANLQQRPAASSQAEAEPTPVVVPAAAPEEPREAYGPMAEFLAEAAEPALGMDASDAEAAGEGAAPQEYQADQPETVDAASVTVVDDVESPAEMVEDEPERARILPRRSARKTPAPRTRKTATAAKSAAPRATRARKKPARD